MNYVPYPKARKENGEKIKRIIRKQARRQNYKKNKEMKPEKPQ